MELDVGVIAREGAFGSFIFLNGLTHNKFNNENYLSKM